ncbi:MAG: ABC transporter ATP-binding protein [Synergistetes bacterium]|nr:ABC transporter ATP-binding protein [Synergistota bacterium]MDW8192325.1 ABC transporter ATP-binding protein [Synergistota bacterium]
MEEKILELKSITKRFGGIVAVKDFSIEVMQGELVGLIGPNGAGKTTVFNLITGVYPVDEGKVLFKGKDITRLKSHEIVKKGIGRTFQNLRLFPRATVLENVMTACQNHLRYSFLEACTHLGKWRSYEKRIMEESIYYLEKLNLKDKIYQQAGTLPYGYQRRLEIARALALKPTLLLLDEPAAGMNPEEVAELSELILKIHKEFNLTTLVIEHHMDLIVEVCPHVICMNFGEKIAEGTPNEVMNHPEVIKAYLGEEA